MTITFNTEELFKGLDELTSTSHIESAVMSGCLIVERAARELAPKYKGELRRSIESTVGKEEGSIVGYVGTPLEYAPYLEYGTGKYAEGGNGRHSPWWIPLGGDFTEKEATKYHMPIIEVEGKKFARTEGMHPHPFMRPALHNNIKRIKDKVREGILND